MLNALKYSKLFNQAELNAAGESLENYGINIITIQKDIHEYMIKIAIEYDMSIFDASYLGLSIAMGGALYTADEKILKKLPKSLKKYVRNLSQIGDQF